MEVYTISRVRLYNQVYSIKQITDLGRWQSSVGVRMWAEVRGSHFFLAILLFPVSWSGKYSKSPWSVSVRSRSPCLARSHLTTTESKPLIHWRSSIRALVLAGLSTFSFLWNWFIGLHCVGNLRIKEDPGFIHLLSSVVRFFSENMICFWDVCPWTRKSINLYFAKFLHIFRCLSCCYLRWQEISASSIELF